MSDVNIDAFIQGTSWQTTYSSNLVWVDPDTGYAFYIDSDDFVVYRKTTNGGAAWSARVVVSGVANLRVAIWFDQWTQASDAGTIIHIVFIKTPSGNVAYRQLDTSDDSFGGEVAIRAGPAPTTSILSLVKARGGNLYAGFFTNVGSNYFYRSTNGGAAWGARATMADGAAQDHILLMPGNEADDNDIWCIYGDISTQEITVKTYDDTGNSWSESGVVTTLASVNMFNYLHFGAAPRHSDNLVILVTCTTYAGAATMRSFVVDGSGTVTAGDDLFTAEGGHVPMPAVMVNQQNDDIYVGYLGGTFGATEHAYGRVSDDGLTSWGAQTQYSVVADDHRAIWTALSVNDNGGRFEPNWFNDDVNSLVTTEDLSIEISAALPTSVGGLNPSLFELLM